MSQLSFIIEKEVPKRQLVRDLPASEQPVNRLLQYSPSALSTIELLAAILQTPDALSLAAEIWQRFRSFKNLQRATMRELCEIPGIGPSKAAQIKATLELGRRQFIDTPNSRPQITSPADVANMLLPEMSHLEQEHVRILVLDTKNRVIVNELLYVGSLNASLARVSEIFRRAIRENAASIIIAHNHPSGDPTPSPEDVNLTRRVVEAGENLDIEVLDHVIIGNQRWVSLKERGLGFRGSSSP